ncbi:methylenetetrahydrofolate--tRNA-(uracil(54)-C(5))-methyltransferase (FADH(2)-oxidizing) TrmFO, partial [Bacillus velezensis]
TNQKNFQPMNANFGLLKELPVKIKNKKERNEEYAKRAIETIQTISKTI